MYPSDKRQEMNLIGPLGKKTTPKPDPASASKPEEEETGFVDITEALTPECRCKLEDIERDG